jgi:hypothetical protein
MTLKNKAYITFIMTFIADLVSSFDFYAMTHDWIWLQLVSGLISQLAWFITSFFLYDSKEKKDRIYLFIATALGCSFGSTVMLLYVKPLFTANS